MGELERQVFELRTSLREAEATMQQHDQMVSTLRAESAHLAAELREERWLHSGARARLEGYQFSTKTVITKTQNMAQKWKSENCRATTAISMETVEESPDGPAMLTGALGGSLEVG